MWSAIKVVCDVLYSSAWIYFTFTYKVILFYLIELHIPTTSYMLGLSCSPVMRLHNLSLL